MSLIVSVVVPTGIVMSGDSRTSLMAQKPIEPVHEVIATDTAATVIQSEKVESPSATPNSGITIPWFQTGMIISDSTYKIYQLRKRFGISTCGASLISGMPVAHHIDVFESKLTRAPESTQILANDLLSHFRLMSPIPNVWFHVAGYDDEEPWIVFVDVAANSTTRRNSTAHQYGAWWNGDFAIAARLAAEGKANIDCSCLNVQDAVDFSRHIIRTTIDQMRFELSFPTVGGPIDTLLIKPNLSEFLLRKEIKCS
jgi:hypothetical protein